MSIAWSPDRIKAAAARYEHRSDFRARERLAYNAAQRWGLLDAVCAHMDRKPYVRPATWTRERIEAEAEKYYRRSDFKRGSPPAYHAARRRGILDEVCAHMGRARARIIEAAVRWATRNGWHNLTREAVAAEAGCSPTLVQPAAGDMGDLKDEIMRLAVERGIVSIVLEGLATRHPTAMTADDDLRGAVKRHVMSM